MLKIYDVIDYVSVDGSDWRVVGRDGYCCTDEERDVKFILNNASFEEAYEHLSNNQQDGIWCGKTYWREKPLIFICYQDAWDSVRYNHFHQMSYKRIYKENNGVHLSWIIKNLPADQTIQYLKERGITTCPMNF